MKFIRGFFSSQPNFDQSDELWTIASDSGSSTPYHLKSSSVSAVVYHAGEASNVLKTESCLYVIAGNPVWRDAGLRAIAVRDGNAAAFASGWNQGQSVVFDQLSGGYVAIVINCDNKHLLLAIDRMGIGRLAYAKRDNGIVFSNNIADIATFGQSRPSLDPQALYNYIFFHQIPSPSTIYSGVFKLGPGQLLEHNTERTEIRRYWSPKFRGDPSDRKPTTDELLDAFRSGITRSLSNGSDGTFLSGGLDSSTVTGLANQISGSPVPAFTIGFDAQGYDEMSFANTVARHFGVEHHQYYLTCSDVAESAPFIAASMDEPFGNSSIIPTYFCAKLAASHGCSTMLAGDGGDELFGGNERYATQRIFEHFGRAPHFLQSLSQALAGHCQASPISLLRKFSSYVSQASVPLPDRLETYNLLTMIPVDQIFSADFLAVVNPSKPLEMMNEVYSSTEGDEMINRLLYFDWKFTLADNDLRKVQTGCALAGIVPTFPLLDLDVVDFSLLLPISDKLFGNTLRPFFRESTKQFLPEKTIKKSKHGFGLPFGTWMQTDAALKEIANDAFRSFAGRNIVRRDFLEWLQEQHRTDHASFYGTVIWVIMMLELWLSANDLSWQ